MLWGSTPQSKLPARTWPIQLDLLGHCSTRVRRFCRLHDAFQVQRPSKTTDSSRISGVVYMIPLEGVFLARSALFGPQEAILNLITPCLETLSNPNGFCCRAVASLWTPNFIETYRNYAGIVGPTSRITKGTLIRYSRSVVHVFDVWL